MMPDTLEKPCRGLSEQIMLYAFNELGFWRRRKLKSHLRRCADCSATYQEYRLLNAGIESLGKKRLPELTLQHVLLRTLGATATSKSVRPTPVVRKWGIAVAGVLLLLVAAAIWQTTEKWNHRQYSQAEIQNAKAEVQTALGMVGKVMNRTQATLANQAVTQNIARPVWQGLEMALKPLMHGG